MGAAPDRHISTSERKKDGQAFGPELSKAMGLPESPKISLVTTAQKAPAWGRSLFNPDSIFKGLMLVAALTVQPRPRLHRRDGGRRQEDQQVGPAALHDPD